VKVDHPTPTKVEVDLGDRSYEVLIGYGVRAELADYIPPSAQRVAIVTQENIPWEVDPGRPIGVFHIGPGEQYKTMETIEGLCTAFADWGLTRADCVVGVGGGMVTDVAGFAASVYHRGLPVVHVATSLLGQIDASIGGKTGVNLTVGKNLVGTYWQPHAVLCDLDTLSTLPARELRCGFGELAKYRWVGERSFEDLSLQQRVSECVRIKAQVVAEDEREAGRRALLNYGHTLAHAIETSTDHAVAHGEAVAIGLVFAADLAHSMGRISSEAAAAHRALISGYDLAVRPPGGLDPDRLIDLMAGDKKATTGLTFVLLNDQGHLEVVAGVDRAVVRAELARFLEPA
jgi:5-deoxy-5-amino-3-dehydroquinate synthase